MLKLAQKSQKSNISSIIRRYLSDSVKKVEVAPQTENATGKAYSSPMSMIGDVHKVNGLERYLLVWTKRFKSVKDVPSYVSRDTMERTRNIVRIRVNLSIAVFCLFGAAFAAYSGKLAAGRGESVQKNNLDWHRKYNEQFNTEKKPAE